jgi:hypothetical protein
VLKGFIRVMRLEIVLQTVLRKNQAGQPWDGAQNRNREPAYGISDHCQQGPASAYSMLVAKMLISLDPMLHGEDQLRKKVV